MFWSAIHTSRIIQSSGRALHFKEAYQMSCSLSHSRRYISPMDYYFHVFDTIFNSTSNNK
jgi:hypothetical protein